MADYNEMQTWKTISTAELPGELLLLLRRLGVNLGQAALVRRVGNLETFVVLLESVHHPRHGDLGPDKKTVQNFP